MVNRIVVRAIAAALIAALALAPRAAADTPLRGELPPTPDGYEVSAAEALAIADRDGNVARFARTAALTADLEAEPPRRWEVRYYDGEERVVLVVVDGVSGSRVESWTGAAVSWPMARGREGQFGHALNAPWVWGALAAVFLLGLWDWRRARRIGHLDLLVLLSFGISHAFFNAAEIGVSVPLAYLPLIYLGARALWIGARGGGAALHPSAPTAFFVLAAVLLISFRIAINVADSGVIDVGYAGVVGADRLLDGDPLWGEHTFPAGNPTGDTYGPANYLAYIPFELALPWSGEWDALPAGHAAALAFDLACVLGLLMLGRRLGGASAGNRLGLILAFAWLAYPYTAFVTQSNSNDSLLAALLIWALVVFHSAIARGALLATAALTKFAPLILLPLFAGQQRGRVAIAFALAAGLLLAHPLVDPGLSVFWDRTIGSQLDRESPFSIWGQTDLGAVQLLAQVAVVLFALAIAIPGLLRPRELDLRGYAALAAAAVIGLQLVAEHWFYLYIVWFFPFLLVALIAPAARSGPAVSSR